MILAEGSDHFKHIIWRCFLWFNFKFCISMHKIAKFSLSLWVCVCVCAGVCGYVYACVSTWRFDVSLDLTWNFERFVIIHVVLCSYFLLKGVVRQLCMCVCMHAGVCVQTKSVSVSVCVLDRSEWSRGPKGVAKCNNIVHACVYVCMCVVSQNCMCVYACVQASMDVWPVTNYDEHWVLTHLQLEIWENQHYLMLTELKLIINEYTMTLDMNFLFYIVTQALLKKIQQLIERTFNNKISAPKRPILIHG